MNANPLNLLQALDAVLKNVYRADMARLYANEAHRKALDLLQVISGTRDEGQAKTLYEQAKQAQQEASHAD